MSGTSVGLVAPIPAWLCEARRSRTPRARAVWSTVVAVCVLGSLSGCTGGDPASSPTAPGASSSAGPSVAGEPAAGAAAGSADLGPLPLSAYVPTPAEGDTLQRAVSLKIAECMGKQGFSFADPPAAASVPSGDQLERRYGVMSAQDAKS